ncbi:MAG: hypothetical protein R3301_10530 [Saprospiraceae bacterium]|nr:hypothetical protein [Saprospiraceae bacterium]
MKQRILTIAFGLFAAAGLPLSGQSGFNHAYCKDLWFDFIDIVYSNDTLTTFGIIGIDSLELWGYLITQYDTVGSEIRRAVVVDTLSHYAGNDEFGLIKTSDGGFIGFGAAVTQSRPVMIKIGAELNLEWVSEYDHNGFVMIPADVCETDFHYVLTGHIQQLDYSRDLFILIVDKSGNRVVQRYYGLAERDDFGSSLVTAANGNAVVGGFFSGQEWIFEIDSSGNVVWEWKSGVDEDQVLVDLQRGLNGEWYYSVTFITSPSPGSYRKTPRLFARDSAFNLLWQNEFAGPTSFHNQFPEIAVTSDNDVVAVGQIRQLENHPVTGRLGWVTKVSAAGEKMWTVIDTAHTDLGPRHHHLNGVALAPSGTIYAAGYTQEYYAPGRICGWILKVTPDGCVDTICFTTGSNEYHAISEPTKIYPNPFTSTVTLDLSDVDQGSVFEVTTVTGAPVYRKEITVPGEQLHADLSHLPACVLIYTIRDERGNVQSGKLVKVD